MAPTRKFGRPRVRFALATVGLLALGASLLASNASANLPGTTFEGNDGNLIVDTTGNTDWANVAGLTTGIDLPTGSNDNSFGSGSKEDAAAVKVVQGSIPPNKNDLTRFYLASSLNANGHTYLQLAWERLVNIGNANLDFEINKNATTGFSNSSTGNLTLNRTAGDLLVTYDFGSGAPTLGLNTWLTAAAGNTASQCFSSSSLPCWGSHISLSGVAEGAVNSTNITDPFLPAGSQTLGPGLFGEASIDLTAAQVFSPGVCEAFGSAFVKSRSSTSFSAELKDFIAPQPVSISNCATIKIHKVTQNGDSSFGYTDTGGLTPSSFSLSNGGEQDFTGVALGNYSVTENLTSAQTTAGWTLASLSCTATTGSSYTRSGSTVNISAGPSGVIDCTYTNHINLSPTIATTLSATTANIGDSIHDSSSLTGATTSAGGTVTYHAYAGANTCTGTDLLADPVNHTNTVTVTNGVVPDSPAFSPSSAGTYSFQAVYSGDGNNNTATSTCSDEQLLVKTNPSIGTTLSATTVAVGSTVHDSATLTNATGDAGGTVTYHAYAGANTCTGTDLLADPVNHTNTVTVTSGSVPDSPSLTLNTAGTYSFQAVYSGDTKNNGATSTCSSEQLTVNPLQPGGSTAQNIIPNDSFTLTGATSGAGGSVTFKLFAPTDASCANTPALSQTVSVSGNGIYSTTNTTFKATTTGTWRWLVTYTGDTNNLGVTSTCGTEQFSITNS